jgi:serine/threonine-protein kinase
MTKQSISEGDQISHYRLMSRLGAGGMGEVYLAEDTRLTRKVALKLLPAEFTREPDRVRRFELEARAASALNHPNILTIFDIGKIGDVHYITTEYIEGVTLRHILQETPKMKPGCALDVAIQVAIALQAAHNGGIIHRDIKPENIMLRPDGYVKVLDFGLAKLTEQSVSQFNTQAPTALHAGTSPGTVMGTVHYMSPEQARGLDVDNRSDIFSLGIVLYEMIAGCQPFTGPTPSDVIAAILREKHVPLKEHASVPKEIEAIVTKALHKESGKRYQTIAGLVADLRTVKQRIDYEEINQSGVTGTAAAASNDEDSAFKVTKEQTRVYDRSTRSTTTRRSRSRKAIDSLAVLPLINASNDPNNEYLSDGITESIINSLTQLPRLRVVPRSTVFRYKGVEVDPQEVGRELGVRAVLTGRAVQVGDTLVIRTELIDIALESQIWGEQYRRKIKNIFVLQEEIASEISDHLRIKITGEERKRLVKRYTDNIEAYQLYLKGRYYTGKRTEEWIRKGIDHYQQAIELDPNYALAYAGMADSYSFLASSTGGWAPHDSFPKAKAAALKALEIDDGLAEAHTSLGFFRLLYDWNFSEAEREFKRAIELNPNYANAHDGYGFYLKAMGRHEEAVRECLKSQQLDPLSLFATVSLGWAFYFARDFDKAISQCQKALDMDPNFYFAYWNMGLSLVHSGQPGEGMAALSKGVARSGGGLSFYAHFGYACAVAGQHDEARRVLAEIEKLAENSYVSSYYPAIIHIGLGEIDRAFDWLYRVCEERAGFLAFLKVEPVLDPLRSDARFNDLMKRVGLE